MRQRWSTLTPKLTNELSVGANLRLSMRPITNPDQQTPKGNFQITGLGTGNINIVRPIQNHPAVNMGFQDNATWIMGNHTLSFGGEYWKQTMNSRSGSGEFPVIRTTNSANPANIPAMPGLNSTDRSTAQQLTNDLTGAIGTISQTFFIRETGYEPYVGSYNQYRKVEWSLFVQDTWKVRSNLTLNLGLRYEMLPPVWLANGAYVYPIGGASGALGIQGPTGQPTQWGFAPNKGRDVFRTERNNFAPSLGFNWDPFGDSRTVVVGSYRVAYDRFMMVTGSFSGPNYPASTTIERTPFIRMSDPRLYSEILPIPIPKVFEPLGFERLGRAYAVDSNLAAPYVQSWSFGIERQVFGNWKIGASYVGNHSVGMWRAINYNQVEMRNNGFLDAFKIAQRNLAQSGSPITGESLGSLEPLFKRVPSAQYTLITQGQAASLANFLDTTTLTTNIRGGLLTLAGLPATFFRFNPQVENLNIGGNSSHSTWNAMKLSMNRRFEKGLYFQANYTFSKGLTDAIPGQSLADDYRDNLNFKLDKALSELDSTHVVQVNGIWELPFGLGKKFLADASGWGQAILGGWQLNGIFHFTTGRPLSIGTGRYYLSQNIASTANYSGSDANFSQVTRGDQITFLTAEQKASFSNPGAGEAGELSPFAFHGPGGLSMLD
ncbi:MAG: TonB-dependent receptor, partial [Acidobacteriota bacterium]